MRLLYLNHNVAWTSGTFHRAFQVGREMARRGHEVTLVSISPARRWGLDRKVVDGVTVVETPDLLWGVGRTGWDPWDTLWRIAHLRRSAWDIVHAWDSRPVVALPAMALRGRAGAFVMDWCDWWGRGGTQAERTRSWMRAVAPLETFFEEGFRTYPQGTTVISSALGQRAERLGVDPASILLLPQGCDTPGVGGDRAEAKRQLGLPADAKLMVFVGKLIRSDAALLFGTVREVLADTNVWFALVGKHGADVPADLRQHPRVRETGFVSTGDLERYTIAADALVAPLGDTLASRARWPSKMNPFLAAGRVVVTTRVGDLPSLLHERGAGLAVEPEVTPLVEATRRVLADPTLRDNIERAARALSMQTLAWPGIVGGLENFYRDRLEGKR